MVLAFVLMVALALLLYPLWPSLVMAAWTSMLARPFHDRLTRVVHGRSGAGALMTVALVIVALTPLVLGIAAVVPDLLDLVQRALRSEPSYRSLLALITGHAPADRGAGSETVVSLLKAHGKEAISVAALLAGVSGQLLLGTLIYFVATFAALVHGPNAYAWIRERLPIPSVAVDRLRDAFHETGRGLLFSVVITALLIAASATVIYASLGLPNALALGLLTLIAAVIPAVGPFLMWGPIGLGLLLAGEPVRAAILVGLCIAVLAPLDHFVRPILARRGRLQLQAGAVLIAMLAGLVSVGGWGIMLGPLLLRLTIEALTIVHERQAW